MSSVDVASMGIKVMCSLLLTWGENVHFVSINLEVLKRVSTFLWINLESLEVMDMDIFVDKT